MPKPRKLDFEKAETYRFDITKDFGDRLDVFLSKRLPDYSRSLLQRLIKEGRAVHNTRVAKASTTVHKGDTISITVPLVITPEMRPSEIPLDIVYEDEHFVAVNKPAGMVVHPTGGHWEGTLMNALLHHLKIPEDTKEVYRPGTVHRLDKETSGIILSAKSNKAVVNLSEQFRKRHVQKEYHAIVEGEIAQDEGIIDKPIDRRRGGGIKMGVAKDGTGKESTSAFRVLERFRGYTYVAVKPLTGRTHQIRVHVATIGHPCAGDPLYSEISPLRGTDIGTDDPAPILSRQALHAYQITFKHPATGQPMTLSAPLAADMARLLEILRGH